MDFKKKVLIVKIILIALVSVFVVWGYYTYFVMPKDYQRAVAQRQEELARQGARNLRKAAYQQRFRQQQQQGRSEVKNAVDGIKK